LEGSDDVDRYRPLATAPLHILLALRGGERHGYAIMHEVDALSDGTVTMGPGTLYGAIKRLLTDGLIEESPERPAPALDDQRRRYYRMTGLGDRVCDAEIGRLEATLERVGTRPARPARGRPVEGI
jgi:DNA-binding PadR family transcriptional regulator